MASVWDNRAYKEYLIRLQPGGARPRSVDSPLYDSLRSGR